MKIPRVRDFDPDARVPTLKSSLDNMPTIQKKSPTPHYKTPIAPTLSKQTQNPKSSADSQHNAHNTTTGVPPVLPVPPVLVVPSTSPKSKKRTMKQRHPFDIYQDQYDSLKAIAMEDRKQGGLGSMSAMVREAIDKLISEKRKP